MRNKIAIALVLFTASCLAESKFIDFEDNLHPAINKTTEVVIPEFPCAFNGSIIRWNNKILLAFRHRDEQLKSTFRMGCVYLDEKFKPISTPHLLDWKDSNPSTFEKCQDPRLFVVKNKLYVIFSNFITLGEVTTRRMFVAHMAFVDDRFVLEAPICVDAPDRLSKRLEKNWVPFIFNDELLISYMLSPHHVLWPDLSNGELLRDYWSTVHFDWEWGELRGGTPAIKDGDFYIAFFHSSLLMKTHHSNGKKIQHYLMGAYRFQATPPFFITHISKEPIVGKGFYHGKAYPTWKPLHVVFAMGCIVNEETIWVSYGRQDFETWVVEFDKKKLYESLVETTAPSDTRSLPTDKYEYCCESNRE